MKPNVTNRGSNQVTSSGGEYPRREQAKDVVVLLAVVLAEVLIPLALLAILYGVVAFAWWLG